MATRDRRINATLGSVTRRLGSDVQDLAALARRREEDDKLQRPAPAVPFAQVLAKGADAAPAPPQARTAAAEPATKPLPIRGKTRMIRG